MNLQQYLESELGSITKEEEKQLSETYFGLIEAYKQKMADDPTKTVTMCIRDFNDEVSSIYDRISAKKELLEMRTSFLGYASDILKKYARIEKGLVIDGGCATGVDICFLGLKNPSLDFVAYDLSSQNVRKAKQRLKKWNVSNTDVLVADHDHLPFKDNAADLFFTDESFGEEGKFIDYYENSEREWNRARNFMRSLKKGGMFCLTYNTGQGTMFPIGEVRNFGYVIGKQSGLKYEDTVSLSEGNFLIALRKPQTVK